MSFLYTKYTDPTPLFHEIVDIAWVKVKSNFPDSTISWTNINMYYIGKEK